MNLRTFEYRYRPIRSFLRKSTVLAPLLLCANIYAGAAFAQDIPDENDDELMQTQTGGAVQSVDYGDDIIVRADRIRGSVITDVPAIEVLEAADISSYGASSLEDLLAALGPQTTSARGRGSGRPAILLNGRRISGFREIRDLPPEAIERVEVFPEELALQYGFSPDQRVINFILKKNFDSLSAEVEHGEATQGGYGANEIEATYTKIGDGTRLVVDLEYNRNTRLLESERGIIQSETTPFALGGNVVSAPFIAGNEIDPQLSALAGQTVDLAGVPVINGSPALADFLNPANLTDLGQFRSLIPNRDQYEANVTYGFGLTDDIEVQLNGTYERGESTSIFGLNSATLNVPATNPFSPFSQNVSVLRYFDDPRTLTRNSVTDNYQLGLSANGQISGWRWALNGNYTRTDSQVLTDQRMDFTTLQAAINQSDPAVAANPFAVDLSELLGTLVRGETRNSSKTATASLTVSGILAELPAGSVFLTLNSAYNRKDTDGSNSFLGAGGDSSLGRTEGSFSANINVPLFEDGDSFGIGQFSINGNFGYEDLSDFGGLSTYGAGLRWSPIKAVSLQASYRASEAAPSIQQLGDAIIVTPNVAIFDQSRNESVLADVITGGNPGLNAERRRDWNFSVNIAPEFVDGLRFTAEYVRNRSFDTVSSFPSLSPEIEAAFPSRIIRDTDGMLTAIDQRAVNYGRVASDRVRYGFSYSKRFGQPERGGGVRNDATSASGRRSGARAQSGGGRPPRRENQYGPPTDPATSSDASGPTSPGTTPTVEGRQRSDSAGTGERPAAQSAEGKPSGRGGMMPGRPSGGRWNVSLFHTVRLTETIQVGPGIPELDLLNGSAIGSSGGVAKHSVELEGGWFNDGLGMRFSGEYGSPTRVDGGNAVGATDLNFGALAKLNARFFLNFDDRGDLTEKIPLLKGARVSLRVDNIFDATRRVTNELGQVPLSYQPGFVDSLGRYVEVSFRKRF